VINLSRNCGPKQSLLSQANQDYFKVHAGASTGHNLMWVTLEKQEVCLGVDGQKGIIYAQMEGAGKDAARASWSRKAKHTRISQWLWPAGCDENASKRTQTNSITPNYFHLCVRSFTRHALS
jgi:hypothetical protein